VLSSRTRRSGSRAAALLRLAAVTVGRTDTALGAFYRRLSARIGKAKAVTAAAEFWPALALPRPADARRHAGEWRALAVRNVRAVPPRILCPIHWVSVALMVADGR
jgi:hypothetical protein